jgi:hypothetical protein
LVSAALRTHAVIKASFALPLLAVTISTWSVTVAGAARLPLQGLYDQFESSQSPEGCVTDLRG